MSVQILGDFDRERAVYAAFTDKAAVLIEDILVRNGINFHAVTARTKDRASLERKVFKPGSSYHELRDITDLSGVRITTYFEDDVDRIVEIIEREFSVDRENSVDKRLRLDPDRFGYLSAHHVVTLSKTRSELPEYSFFDGRKLEIQTRSILQHAWAEIEHDLGYKSEQEIPLKTRRRFSRLAGLLELADSEFLAIKDELTKYNELVLTEISKNPQLIEINRDSLVAYVSNDPLVIELDNYLASVRGWDVMRSDDSIARQVEKLKLVDISTIGGLSDALLHNSVVLKRFAEKWLNRRDENNQNSARSSYVHSGLSLFYLRYILVAQTGDLAKVEKYVTEAGISRSGSPEELAQEILACYASASSKKASQA